MRFGAAQGKPMFNKRLMAARRNLAWAPVRLRRGQKKEPQSRLSGVNREASNEVAPATW